MYGKGEPFSFHHNLEDNPQTKGMFLSSQKN
jgi:hypothetical protein